MNECIYDISAKSFEGCLCFYKALKKETESRALYLLI